MRAWMRWTVYMVLGGFCLWLALGILEDSGQTVLYYRHDTGPRKKQLEELEKSFPGLSAWQLEWNTQVSNRDLGRTQNADCVMVYGNRETAAYYSLDSGTYGYPGDEAGCLISRGLAMKLFGSVAVTGKAVWCHEERYLVRGVTSDPGFLIRIPAKSREDNTYVCLALPDIRENVMKGDIEQILFQHGISQDYLKADGGLYLSAATLCLLLLVWSSTGTILYKILRRKPGEWVRFAGFLLFLALAAAGIQFLHFAGFIISQEIIPERWSNFAFISETCRSAAAEFRQAGEMSHIPWVEHISRRLSLLAFISLPLTANLIFSVIFHAKNNPSSLILCLDEPSSTGTP